MRRIPKGLGFYSKVILLIFLLLFLGLYLSQPLVKQQPICKDCNIVIIDIDVLRAQQLGCYGYEFNTSPNIDRFSNDAILFRNAFSQSQFTFPSHMSVITSTYPSCSRVLIPEKDVLSTQIPTLPEILYKKNYSTVWVGPIKDYFLSLDAGFGRGNEHIFDANKGWNGAMTWIRNHPEKRFIASLYTSFPHEPYSPMIPILKKLTDKIDLTDERLGYDQTEAIKQMRIKQFTNVSFMRSLLSDKLFSDYLKLNLSSITENKNLSIINGFLKKTSEGSMELNYSLTHIAVTSVLREYWKQFNFSNPEDIKLINLLYGGSVFQADMMVGDVIAQLKRDGMYNHTIIVISSDHGQEIFEHGSVGHSFINDETTHVPLLIRIPGVKHYEVENTVENIDIMPTLLAAIGVNAPQTIQGKNLLPYLIKNLEPPEKHAFTENPRRCSVRSKEWRLVASAKTPTENIGEGYIQLLKIENGNDLPGYFSDEFPEVKLNLLAELNKWQDENSKCNYPVSVPSGWKPYISEETKQRIIKTGYW